MHLKPAINIYLLASKWIYSLSEWLKVQCWTLITAFQTKILPKTRLCSLFFVYESFGEEKKRQNSANAALNKTYPLHQSHSQARLIPVMNRGYLLPLSSYQCPDANPIHFRQSSNITLYTLNPPVLKHHPCSHTGPQTSPSIPFHLSSNITLNPLPPVLKHHPQSPSTGPQTSPATLFNRSSNITLNNLPLVPFHWSSNIIPLSPSNCPQTSPATLFNRSSNITLNPLPLVPFHLSSNIILNPVSTIIKHNIHFSTCPQTSHHPPYRDYVRSYILAYGFCNDIYQYKFFYYYMYKCLQ